MAALALALYGIHRLTTLELGRGATGARRERVADAARLAVLLTAFAPMAFFFSAVYSESLYLALSVGLFWSARHGRWAWVGRARGARRATRSAGMVLLLPALMIYLYGPREDRAAGSRASERAARAPPAPALSPATRRAVARAVPLGAVALRRYLGARGRRARSRRCTRRTSGAGTSPAPLWASGTALQAAFDGARQLLSCQRHHVYFTAAQAARS